MSKFNQTLLSAFQNIEICKTYKIKEISNATVTEEVVKSIFDKDLTNVDYSHYVYSIGQCLFYFYENPDTNVEIYVTGYKVESDLENTISSLKKYIQNPETYFVCNLESYDNGFTINFDNIYTKDLFHILKTLFAIYRDYKTYRRIERKRKAYDKKQLNKVTKSYIHTLLVDNKEE